MEKEIKQIDSSHQEMTITMSSEELQPHYDEAYKEAKKHLSMQGFRKGKVPVSMIKKLYGKSIELEAQQDIVNKVFTETVQNDNISVVGQPELANIEPSDDGVAFTVRYETIPTFELQDFKGLTIDEPVHSVTDAEIEAEIKKITIEKADIEIAQEIENENYVVGIKIQELDKETGVPLLDKKSEEQHIFLGDKHIMPELKNNLIGKKGGDSFKLQPLVNNPEQEQKEFQVTVQEIQKLIPAEFTDDFVKEYTKGRFDNSEDLKEEIGFQLQEQWDNRSRKAMEDQIIDQLIDMHEDIPVPESIVSSTMENMLSDLKNRYPNQKEMENLNLENFGDNLRPTAERTVRWEMIRNKIIESEDIKVEEHDIENIVEQEANRTGKDKEEIRKLVLSNQNFLAGILHKKTLDLILDFAITEETEFPEDIDDNMAESTIDEEEMVNDGIETFDDIDSDIESDNMAEEDDKKENN